MSYEEEDQYLKLALRQVLATPFSSPWNNEGGWPVLSLTISSSH